MNDGEGCTIAAFAFFFLIGLGVGFSAGSQWIERKEQQKAIEAKVGRWEIDSQTGEKKFVYGYFEEKSK